MGAILMPSYCVSGAGTTTYNGTYDPFSSSEYRKADNASLKILYNGDDLWYFFNGSTEGYVANGSGAAPPLTGWVVAGRPVSEPAPTLTEGACGAPSPTPTPTPSYVNFPTSPSVGQNYTFNSIMWTWNGVGWKKANNDPSDTIFLANNFGGL